MCMHMSHVHMHMYSYLRWELPFVLILSHFTVLWVLYSLCRIWLFAPVFCILLSRWHSIR